MELYLLVAVLLLPPPEDGVLLHSYKDAAYLTQKMELHHTLS